MKTSGPAFAARPQSLNVPAADMPAIFTDPMSRAAQQMLDRLAPTDATLLIIGETGTGKEMAARYVHARSRRRGGPFLAVNCGALSESLAEAELFGHEKGAFTGAIKAQRGWFEAASGGTLLLDEVGDLPAHLQVKLLRVLQEREVTRVGSRHSVPIDVRVIAATNIDLSAAIAARRFREDLYFRLNVATILLPPLRERKDGLPVLVQHFLKLYADRLGRPGIRLSKDAMALLAFHTWPGNIRELENVIHNAVLLTEGDIIEAGQLQITPASPAMGYESESLEAALRRLFAEAIRTREPDMLTRTTRTLVQTAFDLADGNQVNAAAMLGTSRNALRTQLAHLGVIAPRRHALPNARTPAVKAPRKLRLGYQKFATLGIVKARQTLETALANTGTTLAWVEFPAGPQLLAALDAGLIDFGTTGEVPPVFAQAAGSGLRYVAYEPPSPKGIGIVVPRESDIRTMAELRGRRVVFNRASNVHYLLIRALEASGLTLADIQPVYSPPSDPAAELPGIESDARVLWDPLLTMTERSSAVRLLINGEGLVPNHHFHLASARLAADEPALVNLVLDTIREVGRYVAQNQAEAAQALSSRLGIDVPALEVAFSRLSYGARPIDQVAIWEQQKIADRFYALGLIPRAIAIRDAVSNAA